jgi:uncharacterized protein YoxC
MILEIAVAVLSIAFLLFAVFSIPSLLQIRKTAEAIATTLQSLNENLPAILKNLDNITTNISRASITVNQEIEGMSASLKKLQRTIVFIADLGQVVQAGVRIPFLNTLTSLSAVLKGVRVFLNVLSEKK